MIDTLLMTIRRSTPTTSRLPPNALVNHGEKAEQEQRHGERADCKNVLKFFAAQVRKNQMHILHATPPAATADASTKRLCLSEVLLELSQRPSDRA